MMGYDVKGIIINIVDLNMIGQCINEITGNSYPAVDVNGDREVDIKDITLVSGQIEA